MSSTLRPVFWALALAGSVGAAQAQSSYALTKLGEPFLGKHDIYERPGQLDSQNRVSGSGRYVSGFRLYNWGAEPGFTYTTHVVRWPASTAASITPAKLVNETGSFGHQSPDGSKVFLLASANPGQYYDTVKRQFVTVPQPGNSAYSDARSINDSGAMAGTGQVYVNDSAPAAIRALRWAPGGAAPDVLPIGDQFNRSTASFINRSGAAVGDVVEAESGLTRAAIWRESGAFEILNQAPDTNSGTLGVSDAGDVLVWSRKVGTPSSSYAVIGHGVAKTIDAPTAGDQPRPTSINIHGVVVGVVTQPAAPEGFRERAFIWKDGLLTDLTAWVTAKGLKLPQGSVISGAWQVNAQGSILASLRSADGKVVLVRLTAKP